MSGIGLVINNGLPRHVHLNHCPICSGIEAIATVDNYGGHLIGHLQFPNRLMSDMILDIKNGFLDPQNLCLDTKIMFLSALEQKISLLLALLVVILTAIL
jgi:hypothetical protein